MFIRSCVIIATLVAKISSSVLVKVARSLNVQHLFLLKLQVSETDNFIARYFDTLSYVYAF